MIVEQIINRQETSDNTPMCRIELTLTEAKAIMHSLGRTMCKGDQLTVSMELEDKLLNVISN